MNQPDGKTPSDFKSAVIITVVGVAVTTFVVIFLALFGGIWLDRILKSRPIFTISFVIISIPVTVVLMLRIVKVATRRIKPTQTKPTEEENHHGTGF
jgi:F0F1-type ATP synthase assembly protein I